MMHSDHMAVLSRLHYGRRGLGMIVVSAFALLKPV